MLHLGMPVMGWLHQGAISTLTSSRKTSFPFGLQLPDHLCTDWRRLRWQVENLQVIDRTRGTRQRKPATHKFGYRLSQPERSALRVTFHEPEDIVIQRKS